MSGRQIAMSDLIDIYLDGVCSGSATTALGLGLNEEQADAAADRITGAIKARPMAIEAVASEIRQRLRGADLGPFTATFEETP